MKDDELMNMIHEVINQKSDDELDDSFYIVDLNEVVIQYQKWISMLPNIKPYFAIKSNPDLKIIRLLAKLGCNFDCASKSEISTVLNIVDDPNRIIFANPCKIPSHLVYAKANNVSLMTFDCVEELYKIKQYYHEASLLLRLCVDDSNSKCKFNSKFGCKLDNIDEILKTVKKLDLKLKGFSFHVGSGCEDAKSYYTAIKDCRVAYTIACQYGIFIDTIDIGGGFVSSDENKFEEMCVNIKKAQDDFFKSKIENGYIKFIAEPGRFFTETTHTLCLNVIAKKNEGDVIKYYLNEGVYGSFNCIYYDHQIPILHQLKNRNTNIKNSTFFGPTCDSIDVIYKNIPFQELEIGDWLYIKNFGSYTCAPSSSFNGFQTHIFEYIYPEIYNYLNQEDQQDQISPSSSISSFSF
jgi:ornithine decarboxylase